MTKHLLQHGTPSNVPQSEQLRSDQVRNDAGGFVWELDKWGRLRRFLILGSEGGTFYASERKATKQNVAVVRECLAEDGVRLVNEIVEISVGGKAIKNDTALWALACAISEGDRATKRAAAAALPQVARIGTHLFDFASFAQSMRGWGRTLRWAVANWYLSKPTDRVAFQAVKYRQRNGWTHADLLRLAHPSTDEASRAALFGWIVDGTEADFDIIRGFIAAQAAETPKDTARLVREFNLPREALKPEHLTSNEVWAAMLDMDMPLTAMLRNLANMTRTGVLDNPVALATVKDAITNGEILRKARVHPYAILVALATYKSGRGFRGQNTWTPIPKITDALDKAFYAAFENVEPTGKRILVGLDVSGSMSSPMGDSPLTVREAATAMAMVQSATEEGCDAVAFASGGWTHAYTGRGRSTYWGQTGLRDIDLSARRRLDDVVAETRRMRFGGTDCALPMIYATHGNKHYDAFVIYTDNETWAGGIHPAQALKDYRRHSGIDNARLIVVGMTSNGFSIADPKDPGMLDVVGFSTDTPRLISEFIAGTI